MASGLAARLAHTDPRLLLPAGIPSHPDRLDLRVAVRLPASGPALYLALAADPSGSTHLIPAVVDATGLRRARPGDGFAVAVLDLLAAGRVGPGYHARPGLAVRVPLGDTAEAHVDDGADRELFSVGEHRVALSLRPAGHLGESPDVIGALERAGYSGMLPWVGDVVLAADARVYGPVAQGAIRPSGAPTLGDRLIEVVAGHLRGGEDPTPTLRLADSCGRALAGLHVALATVRSPRGLVRSATAEEVAVWRRDASDAVAEAVVVADGEPSERLRGRRSEVRAALDVLSDAEGTVQVQSPVITGPDAYVVVGDQLRLDPLATAAIDGGWRPPVRDVAAMTRGIDHIARTVHRRLVAGGFPAPVERVASWYQAVRVEMLASYRAELGAAGLLQMFDERLMLPFEVEAECRSLSHAARYLPTTRGIFDAALADLLSPR